MTDTILIVEDELFVVLDLEDLIAEEGFSRTAHCGTLKATLQALETHRPACAILDVRLPDGEVFPAADQMHELGVPLIFHSGHANEVALQSRYPKAQICSKPSSPRKLRAALQKAMAGSARA